MAEVKQVQVPDIGDFADVPIIEVMVNPGDTIAPEDPLVTLESDKATMDVPAPFGGVVQQLMVKVGDTVSQGSALLTVEVGGSGDALAAAEAAPGHVAAAPAAEAAAPEAVASAETAESSAAAPPGVGPPADATAPPYAGPGVRRLARERGVDLSGVTGSGRKGRILKTDLETAGRLAAGDGLGLAPWPQVDFAQFGPIERAPLSRIKRIAGPNLHRNWVMIPHVTHHDEADITDLEAFRKRTNAEQKDVKVTMVALLLKALIPVLQAFPEVNASLDGDDLILKRYYHLGFAADTPNGLVVPVIRDVDQKGLLALAQELTELSGRAREGKLGPTEMQGGTFTISSLGGIGGTAFTPIVNAPEVAILGVTRAAMKPVWDGEAFQPRLVVPLSLAYDHRVIDGAAAARFTARLATVLTDLRRALL